MNGTLIEITPGDHVRFGDGLGTRFLAPGFVEHDLPPRRLGAPTHTHTHEDEWSYIVTGTLSAQIGDDVVHAGPGELVHKPKGTPHAMWNAGDEPVVFLEVIEQTGFQAYFFEIAPAINAMDVEQMAAVWAKYELLMDPGSIPVLIAEHGLEG